jgi:hypothetical protein
MMNPNEVVGFVVLQILSNITTSGYQTDTVFPCAAKNEKARIRQQLGPDTRRVSSLGIVSALPAI